MIPTPEAKLRRLAAHLHALSCDAWEELPGGVLRVSLASPQFSLIGFRQALTELAEREGYQVREIAVRGYMGRVRRLLEMRPGP